MMPFLACREGPLRSLRCLGRAPTPAAVAFVAFAAITAVVCTTSPATAAKAQAVRASRPVPQIRRVLIISVDGLRPDILLRAAAPNVRALMKAGSFTFWARTIREGYTVPSHTSMLTGVVPARHGVTWDNYIEDAYPKFPTLFELAKRAGYTTALSVGKTKLIVLTKPGTLDWKYLADEDNEGDLDVSRHAVAIIQDHHPDVLFVHLAGVDVVGHARGWGSDEQLKAIETADRATGEVLQAVARSGLTDSTLIILTADHGGEGFFHPPEDVRSQVIPWIAAGPGIRANFDLTSVSGLEIRTVDTFATASALLGIPYASAIDGKPVLQILDHSRSSPRPHAAGR